VPLILQVPVPLLPEAEAEVPVPLPEVPVPEVPVLVPAEPPVAPVEVAPEVVLVAASPPLPVPPPPPVPAVSLPQLVVASPATTRATLVIRVTYFERIGKFLLGIGCGQPGMAAAQADKYPS
jgi:hypothetical protein